jgi:hypothetical protein
MARWGVPVIYQENLAKERQESFIAMVLHHTTSLKSVAAGVLDPTSLTQENKTIDQKAVDLSSKPGSHGLRRQENAYWQVPTALAEKMGLLGPKVPQRPTTL